MLETCPTSPCSAPQFNSRCERSLGRALQYDRCPCFGKEEGSEGGREGTRKGGKGEGREGGREGSRKRVKDEGRERQRERGGRGGGEGKGERERERERERDIYIYIGIGRVSSRDTLVNGLTYLSDSIKAKQEPLRRWLPPVAALPPSRSDLPSLC